MIWWPQSGFSSAIGTTVARAGGMVIDGHPMLYEFDEGSFEFTSNGFTVKGNPNSDTNTPNIAFK
mgnify:FL=1